MTDGNFLDKIPRWAVLTRELQLQMTVANVFFVHQRGLMNTIYVWVANVRGLLTPFLRDISLCHRLEMGMVVECDPFCMCTLLFLFSSEDTKCSYTEPTQGILLENQNDSQSESKKQHSGLSAIFICGGEEDWSHTTSVGLGVR